MAKKKTVEITIPVYNEQDELVPHITKLHAYCKQYLNAYGWHITIADNASVDATPELGNNLATKHKTISYIRIPKKGRGRAIKTVWSNQMADISVYMDIDLSTKLAHLPELIEAVDKGYDIAIGSRLLKKSEVINRTVKREFISRSYNLMIKSLFGTKFSDAQCGFKAISKLVLTNLLPEIQDNEWFLDSELLIIAEKAGYRIFEVPVVWTDNPGSTVRVLPTAMGDIQGLLRIRRQEPWKAHSSR